ncbi:MAG: hypothetical protein C0609_02480 [Deltaproteobacteria bacterium]|nr:MAG: hypothetical protein C0609_02480 [Deltaproteobacteria bacterium]
MAFISWERKKTEAGENKAGGKFGSRLALISLVCAVATAIVAPSITTSQKVYQEGDIAPDAVKATRDFLVVDEAATEAQRAEAPLLVPKIYDRATDPLSATLEVLDESFATVKAPPTPTPTPTPPAAEGTELTAPIENKPAEPGNRDPLAASRISKLMEERWSLNISPELAALLTDEANRLELKSLVTAQLAPLFEGGVVANRDLLVGDAGHGSGVIVRGVGGEGEGLLKDLSKITDYDTARKALAGKKVKTVGTLDKLSGLLSAALLTPNLIYNQEETQARREAAAKAVSPILYQVRRGEMIVREGDRVSEVQAKKLVAHAKGEGDGASRWSGYLALMLGLTLLTTLLMEFGRVNIKKVRTGSKDLLFITSLFLVLLLLQRLGLGLGAHLDTGMGDFMRFAMPMGAAFITMRMVLNSETLAIFFLPFTVAAAVGGGLTSGFFIPLIFGGLTGAHLAGGAGKRMDFLKIGLIVGAAQVVGVMLVALHKGSLFTTDALWPMGGAFVGGLVSGLLALSLVPLAETILDYTTDMRLMELASLDHPLLKELLIRAPGSYHHSVVVGTLVKGAAEAIGARAVLAMVAAYYHDIGKIRKPAYFIENQGGGKNPHDKLSPPMSTLVITSHVKDGVELAEKYRLGKDIVDIISQHHGTRLLHYFYDKAKEGARPGVDGVSEVEYSYSGPKPQSREAALVLLADVVEAATRTLPTANQSRVQGAVQTMINRIFAEGQLDECDLSLKDLHQIARSFTLILTGIHHQRIDYPLPVQKEKKEDGDLAKRRQSEGMHGRGEAPQEGEENLKRLGI